MKYENVQAKVNLSLSLELQIEFHEWLNIILFLFRILHLCIIVHTHLYVVGSDDGGSYGSWSRGPRLKSCGHAGLRLYSCRYCAADQILHLKEVTLLTNIEVYMTLNTSFFFSSSHIQTRLRLQEILFIQKNH